MAQIVVAIGTLIGGILGYVLLMTFVAQGNPQPGLPLLNGGAILGYIISGIYAVGPAESVIPGDYLPQRIVLERVRFPRFIEG